MSEVIWSAAVFPLTTSLILQIDTTVLRVLILGQKGVKGERGQSDDTRNEIVGIKTNISKLFGEYATSL